VEDDSGVGFVKKVAVKNQLLLDDNARMGHVCMAHGIYSGVWIVVQRVLGEVSAQVCMYLCCDVAYDHGRRSGRETLDDGAGYA
jgi:hypothetical protein